MVAPGTPQEQVQQIKELLGQIADVMYAPITEGGHVEGAGMDTGSYTSYPQIDPTRRTEVPGAKAQAGDVSIAPDPKKSVRERQAQGESRGAPSAQQPGWAAPTVAALNTALTGMQGAGMGRSGGGSAPVYTPQMPQANPGMAGGSGSMSMLGQAAGLGHVAEEGEIAALAQQVVPLHAMSRILGTAAQALAHGLEQRRAKRQQKKAKEEQKKKEGGLLGGMLGGAGGAGAGAAIGTAILPGVGTVVGGAVGGAAGAAGGSAIGGEFSPTQMVASGIGGGLFAPLGAMSPLAGMVGGPLAAGIGGAVGGGLGAMGMQGAMPLAGYGFTGGYGGGMGWNQGQMMAGWPYMMQSIPHATMPPWYGYGYR